MARKKAEKNPLRRERLIRLMDEVGISQSELSRKTGIAQQNLSKMLKESDYLNLSESSAEAIIEAFPDYRIQWLLGYDDYPTQTDLVLSFITEAKELKARMQTLFVVLAEMNGWSLCDSVISFDMRGIPLADMADECYAKISDGETTVTFSKADFREFVNKIADYFAFELEHIGLEHMEFSDSHIPEWEKASPAQ